MKTCVISASTRSNSQSKKIAEYLKKRLEAQSQEASLVDLFELRLPMYEDDSESEELSSVRYVKEQLAEADGYVVVTPEWNGMASIGLLNMFHYLSQEMAHKPVMLVGVSAGRGGSYPILQLRQMGYKNRHFVIIPEQLVITDCKNVFNDSVFAEDAPDFYIKKRADYALSILIAYEDALQSVRQSGVVDLGTYPNGM